MDWHSIGQLISLFIAIWFGHVCVLNGVRGITTQAAASGLMSAATATFIWLTWL